MLDFSPVRNKNQKIRDLAETLTVDDLRQLTNEMIDTMLQLIADCDDMAVVFEPVDPLADDPYASDASEVEMAWTLGHVLVHVTASAEESAALAAELARGVEFHGRSRSEVPWKTVTTIAQCRQRLEESRRMRLASLDMWPDTPDLKVHYVPWASAGRTNAVGRFILGLKHDDDHLGQLADIVSQAKNAALVGRRLWVTEDVDQSQLAERWQQLMVTIGVNVAAATAVYTDLIEHYSEPVRYYHDLAHVAHMLEVVDNLAGQAKNLPAIQLAVWFHDVIYEMGANDNEERSAVYAMAALSKLGVAEALVEETARLVRLTISHHTTPDDTDGMILLDTDLSSFGFVGEAYFAGGDAIRKEFSHIPDDLFYPSRIHVLNHFLDKERLFMTDVMHEALEARAKQNIRDEIARIEERIAAMEKG